MKNEIQKYWNKRFKESKEIWGEEPSLGAQEVLKFLKTNNIVKATILDIGCGYGRDLNFFRKNGYKVRGIEISEEAIKKAKEIYPGLTVDLGDVKNMYQYKTSMFDIVFGNFLLHLFDQLSVRKKILSECYRVLRPGGYLFHTVASIKDPDFGKGKKIGKNLFINERGVKKFFYTKEAILNEFGKFSVLDIKLIEEPHTHDSPHIHKSYLIIAQKIV